MDGKSRDSNVVEPLEGGATGAELNGRLNAMELGKERAHHCWQIERALR
jgi:hypothetical protein